MRTTANTINVRIIRVCSSPRPPVTLTPAALPLACSGFEKACPGPRLPLCYRNAYWCPLFIRSGTCRLRKYRPQPVKKSRPALAGKSFLYDPLAFKLPEPPTDRLARHADPGGQEPLRPPEFIAAGPHEPDQGVFGRLPLEQIRQVRRLLAATYGPVSSPRPSPWVTVGRAM